MDRTALLIVGLGHSGTTILDMAIGTHPEACSLGEVKKLHLAAREDWRCTCGRPVSGCAFWSRVGRRAHERTGRRLVDLAPAKDSPGSPGSLRAIYDAIFDVTDAPVVVDSSMNLTRAKRVRSELRDHYRVLILHMVRDVRSWEASREAADERNRARHGPRETNLRQLGNRWARAHVAIRAAGLEKTWDYLRVRHEDLCDDPAGTLARVHAWAGLSPHRFAGDLDADYHLFAGNRARVTATRIEPVREPWRDDPVRSRLTTYGYPAAGMATVLGYAEKTALPLVWSARRERA